MMTDSSASGTSAVNRTDRPAAPDQALKSRQHIQNAVLTEMNYKKTIIGTYEKALGPGETRPDSVDKGEPGVVDPSSKLPSADAPRLPAADSTRLPPSLDPSRVNGDVNARSLAALSEKKSKDPARAMDKRTDAIRSDLSGLMANRTDIPASRPDLAAPRPDIASLARPEAPALADRPQSRSSSRGFRPTKPTSPRPAELYQNALEKDRMQQLMSAQQQLMLQQQRAPFPPATNAMIAGLPAAAALQQSAALQPSAATGLQASSSSPAAAAAAAGLSRESATAMVLQQQFLAQHAQAAQNLDYARLLQQYQQSAALAASGLNYFDLVRQHQALSNLSHYQHVLAQYSRAWDESLRGSGAGGSSAAAAAAAGGLPSLGTGGAALSQVQAAAALEQQLLLEQQRQRLEREQRDKQRQQEQREREERAALAVVADRERRLQQHQIQQQQHQAQQPPTQQPAQTQQQPPPTQQQPAQQQQKQQQSQKQAARTEDNPQQAAAMVDEHFQESLRLAQEKTQGGLKWTAGPGTVPASSTAPPTGTATAAGRSASEEWARSYQQAALNAIKDKSAEAQQHKILMEQQQQLTLNMTKEDRDKLTEIYTRILRQMEETDDKARQQQLTQQYEFEVNRLLVVVQHRTRDPMNSAVVSQSPLLRGAMSTGRPADTARPTVTVGAAQPGHASSITSLPHSALANVKVEGRPTTVADSLKSEPVFDIYGYGAVKTKTEQKPGVTGLSAMPSRFDNKPAAPITVSVTNVKLETIVKAEPRTTVAGSNRTEVTSRPTEGSITQGRPVNYQRQQQTNNKRVASTASPDSTTPKRKRSGDETKPIKDFNHFVEKTVTEVLLQDEMRKSLEPPSRDTPRDVARDPSAVVGGGERTSRDVPPALTPQHEVTQPVPAAGVARVNGDLPGGSDSDTRSAASPATSARSDGAAPSPSCAHPKLKKAWLQQYGEDANRTTGTPATVVSSAFSSSTSCTSVNSTAVSSAAALSNGSSVPSTPPQVNGLDAPTPDQQSSHSNTKTTKKRTKQADKTNNKKCKVDNDGSPLPPPNQPARKRNGAAKKRSKDGENKDTESGVKKRRSRTTNGKENLNESGVNKQSKTSKHELTVPLLDKDPATKYAINAQKSLNTSRSVEQLQLSGERFVQERPCVELGPKLVKCRECRQQNKRSPNHDTASQPPAPGMPNIFCRFYAFRWLKYNTKKQIVAAGFSSVDDADNDDLDLWRPSLPVMNPELARDTARYIMQQVNKRFCELVVHEKAAFKYAKPDQLTWKRAVQGVRETCDVCEATIFNLHWTCGKCGFVACPDCFISKHQANNGHGGEETKWLTCNVNRQAHELEKMMACQIITNNALWDTCTLKHEVSARESLSQECACNTEHRPNGVSTLSVGSTPRNSSDTRSDYDPNSPLALLADAALSSSDQNLPNSRNSESSSSQAPHQWLGDCKKPVLRLKQYQHPANEQLFQQYWSQAQPVLISGCTAADQWKPEALSRDMSGRDVTVIDCSSHAVTKQSAAKFWAGFTSMKKRSRDSSGEAALLRLRDWPEPEELCDWFHTRSLPLPLTSYTRRDGQYNLVSRLPDFFTRPDLGPRLTAAYGCCKRVSSSPLRLHSADTLSMLLHCHREDDKSTVTACLESCGVASRDVGRSKECEAGAVWYVYSPADRHTVQSFELKVRQEQSKKENETPLFLDEALRRRLATETGVTCRVILQCESDSLLIPAGSISQVRFVSSCMHVSQEFLSAEHIGTVMQLTQDRSAPKHVAAVAHELQVKNVLYHTVKDVVAVLCDKSCVPSRAQAKQSAVASSTTQLTSTPLVQAPALSSAASRPGLTAAAT